MDPRHRNSVHNIPAARTLRRPLTATEQTLWEALRDRRFQGLKFRRQHAVGRFVLDFYCHELRLAVEVDGKVHDSPERTTADAACQAEIESTGIRFIRLRTEQIAQDLPATLAVLAQRITRLPSPV